jgi:hypothetical protein
MAATSWVDSTARRGCLFMSTRRTLGNKPVPMPAPIRDGISSRW